MAHVVKRIWRSGPRRVKRISWGYTLQLHGKQGRRCDAKGTKEDAENALAAAILDQEVPKKPEAPKKPDAGVTLGAFAATYLAEKTASDKRSIMNDRLAIVRFKAFFGAETRLAEITAARVANFRLQ